MSALSRTRGDFAAAFSEVNGKAWVREAFGNVHVTLTDAALVFTESAPVLAYLGSLMAWQRLGVGEQTRAACVDTSA
ncbi:hypothetical protein [Deinococcus yunweiensis]|uniref:hypothetical protein n=1 Tax=Deinococcus yunweiensis TaxID=367282 RepID=UPI00398E59F5